MQNSFKALLFISVFLTQITAVSTVLGKPGTVDDRSIRFGIGVEYCCEVPGIKLEYTPSRSSDGHPNIYARLTASPLLPGAGIEIGKRVWRLAYVEGDVMTEFFLQYQVVSVGLHVAYRFGDTQKNHVIMLGVEAIWSHAPPSTPDYNYVPRFGYLYLF